MSPENHVPRRITDLVDLKRQGAEVTCEPVFEIIPVDFTQQNSTYQAYVFLCRYTGQINGEPYVFRKCYARGGPDNLGPRMLQAVMIANHYLARDYERMKASGIKVPNKEFSLEEMTVKLDGAKEESGPPVTIDGFIPIAKADNAVQVDINLEFLSGVEHFANYKNEQTFLNADFKVQALGKNINCQRCLACYATDREKEDKPQAVRIANQRLTLLYQEFDNVSIGYEKVFFE
jgi:hypothetical protein